jgi:hypothetical protein
MDVKNKNPITLLERYNNPLKKKLTTFYIACVTP